MASDKMEPFHIHNAKDDDQESEEILDLLPSRFREISGSSMAMESFNLMNDDLISHLIIPPLHSRVRSLITNARPGGLITNRLRHLVDAAPPSPKNTRLLFRLIPQAGNVSEMKFIECAIRDKRLSPFPHHEFTALTIPHWPPQEDLAGLLSGAFVEMIGHKIIFWNHFDGQHPFCYILNAEYNSDRAFRALDTSIILEQLPFGYLTQIVKAVVGDQLIVLLITPNRTVSMLSLEVNTERWSVLPESPAWFSSYNTAIPWKGKLYIVDINTWVIGSTDDVTEVVSMHFDFQRNMWVMGGDENTAFARCFMSFFPRYEHRDPYRKLVIADRGRCMISSKSGTLYAISCYPQFGIYSLKDRIGDSDEYPIGNIYALDDLTHGWRQIECRKSEHTQRDDPFKLPKLPHELRKLQDLRTKMNCWEINENDILLVVSQSVHTLWARYAWWIFNKDDGVKNYGCEELSTSAFGNYGMGRVDISILKFGM